VLFSNTSNEDIAPDQVDIRIEAASCGQHGQSNAYDKPTKPRCPLS
ncbi:hypothetical protein RRG08_018842, partial [Elysia crispata]